MKIVRFLVAPLVAALVIAVLYALCASSGAIPFSSGNEIRWPDLIGFSTIAAIVFAADNLALMCRGKPPTTLDQLFKAPKGMASMFGS